MFGNDKKKQPISVCFITHDYSNNADQRHSGGMCNSLIFIHQKRLAKDVGNLDG